MLKQLLSVLTNIVSWSAYLYLPAFRQVMGSLNAGLNGLCICASSLNWFYFTTMYPGVIALKEIATIEKLVNSPSQLHSMKEPLSKDIHHQASSLIWQLLK